MSNRRKLVESERTQWMVMSAWKAREMLKKEHQLLDNHKELVVGRITLNQRITYKRFKHKLDHSKITHAKIMGDKKTVQELKAKARANEFNTNFGLDPVDEEVLEKIWSSSKKKKTSSETQSNASDCGMRRSSARPQRPTSVTVPRPTPQANQVERPRTSPAPRYISTGQHSLPKSVQWESDEENEGDEEDHDVFEECEIKGKLSRPKFKKTRPISAPPQSGNIFSEGDQGPTLLEIHKERIKSAGYENRVKGLCGRMQAFTVGGENLIPDYYKYCRDAESDPIRLTRDHGVYRDCDVEENKAMGNPHVKSLTMKPLVINGAPYVNHRLMQTLPDYRPKIINTPLNISSRYGLTLRKLCRSRRLGTQSYGEGHRFDIIRFDLNCSDLPLQPLFFKDDDCHFYPKEKNTRL
ncbi:hypothetical protein CAPTEDRAFT_213999 [Capitella teleta]|uniref:Uncharacterized protein n=1 Tax=Capitella teleta TaxID=283909 RepID=R7TKE0_CAPTE|nr:hypothetical protein CAPTEDRAFT_213999 [Capitella teleta]|eukprot:ELT94273.1 hypothetical protein CAPTEDRAFT_213999 [Capitella teleta]